MVLLGLAHGQVFDGPPISIFEFLIAHAPEFVPSYLYLSYLYDIRAMHDGALDSRFHENSIPTLART